MLKSTFLLLSFTFISSFSLLAKVETLSLKKKVFKNTKKCEQNKTCDLKKVNFEFSQYKVSGDRIGINFGTSLFSSYQTKKIKQLNNYVFVQFIKGCKFSSTKNEKKINDVRKFYGNYIKFKHSTMVIDSVDTDPVYNSAEDENRPRHFYYRWNSKKNSFNIETENIFGYQKPKFPILYVVDHPGGVANVQITPDNQLIAKNISIKLKTCLYKNTDVPVYLSPETDQLEGAITCYEWSSSFIFNHKTKLFESKEEIDPICL